MKEIPDHLEQNLNVLFVGFNPSIRSSETGHHYANPNNRFWKILNRSGLTPREFASEEDIKLLELGFGLTNIVPRPTKEAAEITKEEYREGRKDLQRKIVELQPKIVCFVGKGVYQQYSKKKKTNWGFQWEPVIEGVEEFVAPSSSGLVRMKMAEIVSIYEQLSSRVKQLDKKEG